MPGGAPKKIFFDGNALSGSIHSTYQLPSLQTDKIPTLGQPTLYLQSHTALYYISWLSGSTENIWICHVSKIIVKLHKTYMIQLGAASLDPHFEPSLGGGWGSNLAAPSNQAVCNMNLMSTYPLTGILAKRLMLETPLNCSGSRIYLLDGWRLR